VFVTVHAYASCFCYLFYHASEYIACIYLLYVFLCLGDWATDNSRLWATKRRVRVSSVRFRNRYFVFRLTGDRPFVYRLCVLLMIWGEKTLDKFNSQNIYF